MWDPIKQLWHKYQGLSAIALSAVGGIAYTSKSWIFVHSLASIVYDESGYIARGFLIASGKYWPYADYGPFLDHMPLSFIIPGYVQVLFGPGIRTGRYFAFIMGLFSLLGLWIATRSLGGKWWAAVAVWAVAANPLWIETFSLGYSQVLVVFLLTWSMVFAIGKTRKSWQIILASSLAGLTVMTRLNMLPVLFLLILYFFWQHGRKAGIIAAVAGLVPTIILHAIFWPGILKMWAIYIPEGIIPFIDPFRIPWVPNYLPDGFSLSGWASNRNHLMWDIIKEFFRGVRVNIFPVMGVFTVTMLWPKRKNWKSDYLFRIASFFLITYLVLFLMHMWVALSGTSCPFSCFKGYLIFFNNIGILLTAVAVTSWKIQAPLWRQLLFVIFFSLFILVLVNWEQTYQVDIKDFFESQMNTMGLQTNFSVGFNIFEQKNILFSLLTIPMLFVGVLKPLPAKLLKFLKNNYGNFDQVVMIVFLTSTLLFSPLETFGGRINTLQCEDNIIESHEKVGRYLYSIIPKGSKVYWGVKSWMMLLYLPQIEIFPPQTLSTFSFIGPETDIDPDTLYRYGFWNVELKEKWIDEADFILVEGRFVEEEWQSRIDSGELNIHGITDPVESCRGDDSRIFLLISNPGFE